MTKGSLIIIPIFQMRKMSPGEIKCFAASPEARKQLGWDLNLSSLWPSSFTLNLIYRLPLPWTTKLAKVHCSQLEVYFFFLG